MAMIFMDSFQWVTGSNWYGKWASSSVTGLGLASSPQRFTGYNILNFQTDTNRHCDRNMGANFATGCVGIAFRAESSSTYSRNIIGLFDGDITAGATNQIFVRLNNDLSISIYRGSASNLLGTTAASIITTGVWCFLELKFEIAASTVGSVVLYKDGVAVLTLTPGTNTKNSANAYMNSVILGGNNPTVASGGSTNIYKTDFYFIDFTGSFNNTPLGPCRVTVCSPSGNGQYSQFVNTAGTSVNNYTYVNETTPNDDTSYVETGTVANEDSYAFTDQPATVTTILAIQVGIFAKKTDASARTAAIMTRTGGTDYASTATPDLNTNYQYYSAIQETKPGTSPPAAWSVSDLNAAEFGHKCNS